MTMKILVLGETGMLGAYSSLALSKAGHRVVAVSRRRTDNGFRRQLHCLSGRMGTFRPKHIQLVAHEHRCRSNLGAIKRPSGYSFIVSFSAPNLSKALCRSFLLQPHAIVMPSVLGFITKFFLCFGDIQNILRTERFIRSVGYFGFMSILPEHIDDCANPLLQAGTA